uniref:Metalloendopeptidase n=1 Tax=Magallana gigas TaxID=29159 RepID=K1QN98_MAGGI
MGNAHTANAIHNAICDANIAKPGIDSGMRFINVPVNDICVDRRKLVYSLARILGLPDEHTRPDRDKFLTIHWDNLQKSYRHGLYNISSYDFWHIIRHMPYDFTSVTHAGPFEHAIDSRKPTVSSKYPGVYFSDHYNLSIIDVRKLRALYDCPSDFGGFFKCSAQSIVLLIFLCVVWSMTGHRLVTSGQREKDRCLGEAHKRTTLMGLVRKTLH